ncbi:MAG TPA: SUMF1/EgtB/PvdO family nonheme iron enzyme [Polyangiaceae bacterium]|nr:SUMF1/EgtB/PvdO family nonheme iron enzyme [Polyangiaceae bacterium]
MLRLRAHAVVVAFGAVGVGLLFALKPTSAPVYAGSRTAAPSATPNAPAPANPPAAASAKPNPEPPAPKQTSSGCPPEMALVEHTCVDRWEARLLQKKDDGSLEPHPPTARPTGGVFVAESRAGVKPQGYVSQIEAASACENAGKRLCSLTEWYHACRGDKNTLFPYGPAYVVGRCNVNKPHLLSILHGADPREWKYDEGFNDPELDKRDGFLAETGAYGECVSSAGIYDLVGNLHEWVADRVDASMAHKIPLTAGIRAKLGVNQGKGVFMGGFFSTLNQHGEGCDFITMAHEPGYHDYSTGFRCCKDP